MAKRDRLKTGWLSAFRGSNPRPRILLERKSFRKEEISDIYQKRLIKKTIKIEKENEKILDINFINHKFINHNQILY